MNKQNILTTFGGTPRYVDFSQSSRLMFITHRTEKYTELEEIKMVIEGGCDWVQLRMKDTLNPEDARKAALYTKEISGNSCICCIDDSVDIALTSGAHAVHLGKKDIPVAEAWQIVANHHPQPPFFIGSTANTFEDIVQADKAGASYIGLGPYRFTETKKKLSPILGLEGYRKIIRQCEEAGIQIPIFAIGGIELEDVRPLMETGITGIAVSGAIIQAENPIEETRRFIQEIVK